MRKRRDWAAFVSDGEEDIRSRDGVCWQNGCGCVQCSISGSSFSNAPPAWAGKKQAFGQERQEIWDRGIARLPQLGSLAAGVMSQPRANDHKVRDSHARHGPGSEMGSGRHGHFRRPFQGTMHNYVGSTTFPGLERVVPAVAIGRRRRCRADASNARHETMPSSDGMDCLDALAVLTGRRATQVPARNSVYLLVPINPGT